MNYQNNNYIPKKNYSTSNNFKNKNISFDRKSYNNSNKKVIKPPFRQGLYSYGQTLNIFQDNTKRKSNNKNYYSSASNSPNLSNNKNNNKMNYSKGNLLNLNNIILTKDGHRITYNNSSLAFSTINLNKYKINSMDKSLKFKTINNMNNNIDYNNNNNLNDDNQNVKNISSNVNNNKSINMSITNLNKIKDNNLNSNNNNFMSRKTIKSNVGGNNEDSFPLPHYKNYFIENPKNEVESRRMIIEYLKILNKNVNNVSKVLINYNISRKVLNQKYTENEYYENYELFGEAKKELYLKNLNYSLSSDSDNSNEEDNKDFNNVLSMNNLNSLLLDNEKKKIDILYFLCVPKVLNLIGENNTKQKYIFLVVPDENTLIKAKESYLFQWRDMSNNEVENEFNLKLIKSCSVNDKYNNRFLIEVEKEDLIDNLIFEIETPSKEVCDYYVNGIQFLSSS
jgi:hypothetical protein